MDAIPYALGAILLGVVTLAVLDFALQWQPVPASVPHRASLASVSGVILIIGGLTILWRDAGRSRFLLPLFFGLWVLALHVPAVFANRHLGSLLGLAEILSIAIGGWAAVQQAPQSRLSKAARIAYGLCALVFGASHFQYADITASMVPEWAINSYFWAYFTGAAHIAAGLAIMSGVIARTAASMLALMCGLFALSLHLPRVAAAPGVRIEWTMLAMSVSIAGGAWLVRRLAPAGQELQLLARLTRNRRERRGANA